MGGAVGIDHTTYGCPHAAVAEDNTTYLQLRKPDGFWAEAIDPSGRVRWARHFPDDGGSPLSAPAALGADGTVYFASFTGYRHRIDAYDALTGAHLLAQSFYYLVATTTWSGGYAVIDLDGGNYRPVVKYFDHAGTLVNAYPVDDAVAANNGNWSFSADHDGGFLVSGAANCAFDSKDHFAAEAIGPNGKRWIAKSSDWSACGGSVVTPDANGGAYLMTASEDGSIQTLSRLNGGGQLWRTQLPGTSRVGEGLHVDVNGVAVTATVLPYECTPDSPPGSCSGSVLAFTGPEGQSVRSDIDIKDPAYVSFTRDRELRVEPRGCLRLKRLR